MRNSSYYSRLQHLPIECAETDGIPDTLPILIEEIYSPTDEQSKSDVSSLNSKTNEENSLLKTVQNLSRNPLNDL